MDQKRLRILLTRYYLFPVKCTILICENGGHLAPVSLLVLWEAQQSASTVYSDDDALMINGIAVWFFFYAYYGILQ